MSRYDRIRIIPKPMTEPALDHIVLALLAMLKEEMAAATVTSAPSIEEQAS